MIYTIGRREAYAQGFREATPENPLMKIGRQVLDGVPYPGGCCFQTIAEANEYLRSEAITDTFAVYGLLAAWDSDTYEAPDYPHRCLLRDAALVDLEAAAS
jgi:hypothetical protein